MVSFTISNVRENWIRLLDQKFDFGHDKFEVFIRHPSRHVE